VRFKKHPLAKYFGLYKSEPNCLMSVFGFVSFVRARCSRLTTLLGVACGGLFARHSSVGQYGETACAACKSADLLSRPICAKRLWFSMPQCSSTCRRWPSSSGTPLRYHPAPMRTRRKVRCRAHPTRCFRCRRLPVGCHSSVRGLSNFICLTCFVCCGVVSFSAHPRPG
jgi:hypothetical protein